MIEDAALLRRYAGEKSEDAFAELVRRHVNFVYGCALRRVAGDAHLAKDVTQQAFVALAAQAAVLARREILSGWFYITVRNIAAQAVRSERRRLAREKEACIMNELVPSSAHDAEWQHLRPELDQAMDKLDDGDREAVLLRFFEGRSLVEIGGKLDITESGARMRIERALDKMRGTLARRGIVSTAAALSSALAQEGGITAPTGFAASVAGTALTSVAGGGGIAAGLAASAFMSMTKIGGGVTVALLLCASLAGNAYLYLHRETDERQPAPATAMARASVARPVATLVELAKGDLAELRNRLQAAGASETTARGVVEGLLRRRYRETLIAQRAENMKHSWWNAAPRMAASDSINLIDDSKLLREMVLDPLERLFGPDPVELAEKETRFAFLPKETQQAFVAVERNHEAAVARVPGADKNPALVAGLKRERDEQVQQLLAALSPVQRAEYELRFSPTAAALRERMSQIVATEQEYRAIMAVLQTTGLAEANARLEGGYAEKEQRAIDQIVATLGYDRALDYIWAGTTEYPTYARLAREAGLPPSTPGRVLQLAAETHDRAAAIHRDTALSVEQKRAGLLALQQQVKPQLDALLPPAQQQQVGTFIDGSLLAWFTLLGEGRYRRIATTAAGTTGGIVMMGSASIETPPPPNAASRQLAVRRPAQGGN